MVLGSKKENPYSKSERKQLTPQARLETQQIDPIHRNATGVLASAIAKSVSSSLLQTMTKRVEIQSAILALPKAEQETLREWLEKKVTRDTPSFATLAEPYRGMFRGPRDLSTRKGLSRR